MNHQIRDNIGVFIYTLYAYSYLCIPFGRSVVPVRTDRFRPVGEHTPSGWARVRNFKVMLSAESMSDQSDVAFWTDLFRPVAQHTPSGQRG